MDLYYPPRIVTVGRQGHRGRLVHARLWHGSDCVVGERQTIAATR